MIGPVSELAILNLPMEPNDADAQTVGQFLAELLLKVWDRGDMGNKRPFGNSGWRVDLYSALGRAGVIAMTFDADGFVEELTQEEEDRADELIRGAIVSSLWRNLE